MPSRRFHIDALPFALILFGFVTGAAANASLWGLSAGLGTAIVYWTYNRYRARSHQPK